MRRILGRNVSRGLAAACRLTMPITTTTTALASPSAGTVTSLAASLATPLMLSSNQYRAFSNNGEQTTTDSTTTATNGTASASSSEVAKPVAGTTHEDLYVSAMRHVIAELPRGGIRIVEFMERLRHTLGAAVGEEVVEGGKSNPTTYGYHSIFEALLVANDSHYLADDVIVPCDWERVMLTVRAKLPAGGVLEPAFVRYINAEGCAKFKRGVAPKANEGADDKAWDAIESDQETHRSQTMRAIRQQLRIDNPTGASIAGVALHDWVKQRFGRIIEVVDVTPLSVINRARAQGITNPPQTFIYRPIEDIHPYVQILRTAFKCLGCTQPQYMPTAEPLQSIAAIVPLLPTNPKTGNAYTWPEFLQTPEVQQYFETKVQVYVAEVKASQTQIIFVDGTTLQPDEAEAAVHQWRARRSEELGAPVKVKLFVVRREDDPPHTAEDIIIDGFVTEPAHAIAARLSLLADTASLDGARIVENMSGGEQQQRGTYGSSTTPAAASSSNSNTSGWSAVTDTASSTKTVDSVDFTNNSTNANNTTTPSSSATSIGKALFDAENDIEASVVAELEGAADVDANTTTSSATGNILDLPSSLTNPSLPPACGADVVVLVGSRDSKEGIDGGLADYNANKHWIRTMLVVGDEEGTA